MCLSLVKKMRNIEKFRTFADFQKKRKRKKNRNKARNKNTQKTTKNKKESILKTRLGLKRLIFLMF